MNKVLFDIAQNMDNGYTSTASKEAYKRYFAQKAAPLDFEINIDGEAITKALINAIEDSGATVE